MRLFLDANILFTAAHNPAGKAALVIALGKAGIWRLISSAFALEEAHRNLMRKYPDCLARFDADRGALTIVPDRLGIACPDPLSTKDHPIYCAALGCKADVLLTGDLGHFGFLMNDPRSSGGLLIQTVAELLASR